MTFLDGLSLALSAIDPPPATPSDSVKLAIVSGVFAVILAVIGIFSTRRAPLTPDQAETRLELRLEAELVAERAEHEQTRGELSQLKLELRRLQRLLVAHDVDPFDAAD